LQHAELSGKHHGLAGTKRGMMEFTRRFDAGHVDQLEGIDNAEIGDSIRARISGRVMIKMEAIVIP
jgi:hypothetical protein